VVGYSSTEVLILQFGEALIISNLAEAIRFFRAKKSSEYLPSDGK
jgi:hypothetical protein